MEITLDLVKHLAKLSRLNFSDQQLEKFKEEFARTMEHIDEISKVDTSKIELELKRLDAKEGLREDKEINYLSQAEVVHNAPESARGMIKVKNIVE